MADAAPPAPFTPYQKFVVALLAFLQFTIILDFMILSPLGVMLMPDLKIDPQQFGLVVSAYAFSAGISGVLTGGFADKFDRKKLLVIFYAGFLVGTFLCGIADTYEFLLLARIVTGIFSGVIGSCVFAITTDLFPMQMRGRVMGVIQTSFAASQVMGIPLGLYLSKQWGWHAPFLMIVGIGVLAGIGIIVKMKPVDEHLKLDRPKSAFAHLFRTISTPLYQQAFATTALLATGGFMLMPFASAFSVHNLGIKLDQLPMVYMITGACAIFTGPLIGRASDAIGKFRIFGFGTILTIIMMLIYTHLGVTPLAGVVAVNAIMFVGISSRMIGAQSLMSGVPAPADRGAYMSISSSIQQVSGGIAAAIAGGIIHIAADGAVEGFPVIGYVAGCASLITLGMMWRIQKKVPEGVKREVVVTPAANGKAS